MADRAELLAREYWGGVIVTNCVLHADARYVNRPDDCRLCLADLRNAFARAQSVNKWLNEWRTDAIALLSEMPPERTEAER